MTALQTCSQCGAKYYTKGLCQRCYQAKRRLEHPERAQTITRRAWDLHQEEIKARSRVWYEQHRAEKISYIVAYKATHREAVNARQRARYHARKQEPPPRLASDRAPGAP